MIRFNKPAHTGKEIEYISDAISQGRLSGDNKYNRLCQQWLENHFSCKKVLLTPSCTAGLEMAAILADIKPGDEVIMPSFTFVSTANAFLLRGARLVFVDIRPDTLNIDENKIEAAITGKTRAIVPVHYAGVPCEMKRINNIAKQNRLIVIEDAAQALMSSYDDIPAGTLGELAAFSFHETKNYNCGEGGAIFINSDRYKERAEIIREKGTNRSKFFRGEVDKYTWVDIGSSYLLSELCAAYLYAQLENATRIFKFRIDVWGKYLNSFRDLEERDLIRLPVVPDNCKHNGHMFYFLTRTPKERENILGYLKERGVGAVFHYVPLHSSPMGITNGRFDGVDENTSEISNRIVRLPLYYKIPESDVEETVNAVLEYYR